MHKLNKYKNLGAELKTLAYLRNKPNFLLDIDGPIIKDTDFAFECNRNIYNGIKALTIDGVSINQHSSIDRVILEEKVCALYPNYIKFSKSILDKALDRIYAIVDHIDIKPIIKIVVTNSLKRQSIALLKDLRNKIDIAENPIEIVQNIESAGYEFAKSTVTKSDINILGEKFDSWLSSKLEDFKLGKTKVGLPIGYPIFEELIGGGLRNGTVNIIASRSKSGKSLMGLNISDHCIRINKCPVLYLDTELDEEYQMMRRLSMLSSVPIFKIESGEFLKSQEYVDKINQTKEQMLTNKLYYVDIKGWSIEEQISVIRRFFSKIVGRDSSGKFNPALVILDYLKLMNTKDKGADTEWETLGYRMTALHDLMGQYNAPMIAFAQQNREGLKSDSEETISGSDRIIWLCDSFSVFSKLDSLEMMQGANQQNPINCKLRVVVSRHGPGCQGKKYIGMYADIHDMNLKMDQVCGIIQERGLYVSIAK